MVRASHPNTIEVTKEEYLTEEGDCIIGVRASTGCVGLDERVKDALKREGAVVSIRILVQGMSFELKAKGSPKLELGHPDEIVIRKSEFVNRRTLAIGANAAARDIPRKMVQELKKPTTLGRLEIEVT